MNERIQQMLDKATYEILGVKQVDQKQFAELIVRECVEKLKETKKVELPFLQSVNEYAQELPLSVYIAELNGHFGVEE